MRHLIVGSGQLGSAIRDHLPPSSTSVVRVDWLDGVTAGRQLAEQVGRFLEHDEPSTIVWCAGAGVVGTPEVDLASERDLLRTVLDAAAGAVRPPAQFFLASSAGGVYGGNHGVCDEATVPQPTSEYGRSKLLQESMTADWAAQIGTDALIGRISNLYGPRQNLGKRQGFISHLLASMANQQPFVYSVPSSTIRDFVYTDDVGARVAAWLDGPLLENSRVTTKILAAERSVALAQVATTAGHVTHRAIRVLFAPRRGTDQPAVIRFRSIEPLPVTSRRPPTSLEQGLWLTWQATLRSM